MPQVRSALEEMRPELTGRLAAIMQQELPSLIDEIVREIRETIPEYARPLDGPYGRTLRSGVERALAGFVEWITYPDAGLDDICRKLGRFEAYEGRQLDTLQSAYRVGARTSWRRVMALHRRHDLTPETVSLLADALFAYMEKVAALSLKGYLEAKAEESDALAAGRRRLLRLIVEPQPRDALVQLAERVHWPLPDRLTLVALRSAAPIVRTLLDDDVLTDLDGAEPYVLVPGPLTADRRAMLELAVAESRAAAGPTVALERAADSLRWARQALGLVHEEILDDGPLTLCDDHLVTLWLLSDSPLIDQIARRQLATMRDLNGRQRGRLTTTLRAWLRTRGTAARVGDDLGVHPQTVRYRMRQIEQTLGDELTDPDSRFAIEVVLRALWLRERASQEGPDADMTPDSRPANFTG
jgi:PucR C-terminal helix-turn-helix domain